MRVKNIQYPSIPTQKGNTMQFHEGTGVPKAGLPEEKDTYEEMLVSSAEHQPSVNMEDVRVDDTMTETLSAISEVNCPKPEQKKIIQGMQEQKFDAGIRVHLAKGKAFKKYLETVVIKRLLSDLKQWEEVLKTIHPYSKKQTGNVSKKSPPTLEIYLKVSLLIIVLIVAMGFELANIYTILSVQVEYVDKHWVFALGAGFFILLTGILIKTTLTHLNIEQTKKFITIMYGVLGVTVVTFLVLFAYTYGGDDISIESILSDDLSDSSSNFMDSLAVPAWMDGLRIFTQLLLALLAVGICSIELSIMLQDHFGSENETQFSVNQQYTFIQERITEIHRQLEDKYQIIASIDGYEKQVECQKKLLVHEALLRLMAATEKRERSMKQVEDMEQQLKVAKQELLT